MEIVIKIHDIPQNDHERWVLKNGTPLPLDMAIKALKEPQPTKLRPITAEGAYVFDIETGYVMTNGEYERRHAQPQIKKGKWIDGYCSECGKSCLCDGWGNDIESKFCPECGSFNGGGEDEVSD